ncbi:MAG TPA: zf-HC2 domain-containing protein [bacterium]|nr:zf-HC2 domain-containing protein [bacterium]
MSACDDFKGLLMGLIDEELTPDETGRVHRHLKRCAACRREYEQLRETASKIGGVSYREPADEVLESLWNAPYSHYTRVSGIVLIIGGWAALILYILYEWIVRNSQGIFPKIGAAMMIVGFVILLFTAIRERIVKHKVDPYREVVR